MKDLVPGSTALHQGQLQMCLEVNALKALRDAESVTYAAGVTDLVDADGKATVGGMTLRLETAAAWPLPDDTRSPASALVQDALMEQLNGAADYDRNGDGFPDFGMMDEQCACETDESEDAQPQCAEPLR